jgi:quinol monooxygenase YgiN
VKVTFGQACGHTNDGVVRNASNSEQVLGSFIQLFCQKRPPACALQFCAFEIEQEQRVPANDNWGYLIIWEFRPRAGMERKFQAAYGPHKTWAQFFRRAEGHLTTELFRDTQNRGRYLTLDFWTSPHAYEHFREKNLAEYKRIDELCEELTQVELELGRFERVIKLPS